MKRAFLFFLISFAVPDFCAGGDSDVGPPLVVKLVRGGLQISATHITVRDKEDYLFALVDLSPYRKALGTPPKKADLLAIAQAIADGPGTTLSPKRAKIKVVLVEYSERDDYGVTKIEAEKTIASYEGRAKKGRFHLKRVK